MLDFLHGADLIFSVGIPDCDCIPKYQSNKGFVCNFFCLFVADLKVAPEEAKCLVGFVGDGVDMGAPFHAVWMLTPKSFVGFQGEPG